jgi:hypothetical protein
VDIEIAKKDTYILSPGSYGRITVKSQATLIFTGGTYHLKNLDVGAKAGILFQAPTEVIIDNRLEPGSWSEIGPEAGSGISARDIVFYVNGINGVDGNLDSIPEAAAVGTHSTVKANIYAPNGTVRLKEHSVVEGAALGKDVQLGTQAKLTLDSIFD